MNEVVVYEGLHTYGGMAGRTMEVLARGLEEMCDEGEVQWVMHQTERFNPGCRTPVCRWSGAATAPTSWPTSSCRTRRALPAGRLLRRPLRDLRHVRALATRSRRARQSGTGADPALAMTSRATGSGGRRDHQSVRATRQGAAASSRVKEGTWRDQMSTAGCYCDLEPVRVRDVSVSRSTPSSGSGCLSREERGKAIRRPATTPSCCARPTSPSICSPTRAPRR